MSATSRPLAAAPSTGRESSAGGAGDPGQNPQRPSITGPKPKRTLIESACAACRRRKSKCDGHRPICARCQALKTTCTYEAQEGESRWSALRRRKKDVEGDRDDLRELVTFLQSKPEAEALEIFHRIRANGFEDLLRLIQHAREDGHTTSQGTAPAVGMNEQQRLPSIRTMLETSGPVQNQSLAPSSATQARRTSMSSDGSGSGHSDGSGASNLSMPSLHSHPSRD